MINIFTIKRFLWCVLTAEGRKLCRVKKRNSMHSHVSIDIETLSTANNSLITEVAITFFSKAAYHDRAELGDTVYWLVDIHSQKGRDIDTHTIQWAVNNGVINRLKLNNRTPLPTLLRDLNFLITPKHKVWAKGPDFDVSILSHAFKSETPWAFWHARCVRTIIDKEFHRRKKDLETIKNNAPHTASGDARFQAAIVSLCLHEG